MSEILTVGQLTNKIKHSVEKIFPYVWVKGEVVNCSRPTSGHVYFSLSDQDALLHCVWFKKKQRSQETFDPLTGEIFEDGPRLCPSQTIANGQRVLCAGAIGVYPPHGNYQLLIDFAQPEGAGAASLAFEALKNKLQQLGYFDLSRKRVVPKNPKNVAVITAPTGAAIQDFIRLSNDRGLKSVIRIYPSLVQGDNAPQSIVNAIRSINKSKWADVVVVIRGGGSYQDLTAFNDEQVARAIFTSRQPVLAGIGHESDVTLADMTADLRAATPSHAAQLLWTEKIQILQQIDALEIRVAKNFHKQFQYKKDRAELSFQRLSWNSPQKRLEYAERRLIDLQKKVFFLTRHALKEKNAAYSLNVRRLSQKIFLTKILNYKPLLDYARQKALNAATASLLQKTQRLERANRSLAQAFSHRYQNGARQYEKTRLALASLNPELPIQRGYALVYLSDGKILRSVKEAPEKTALLVHIADGQVPVTVVSKKLKPTQHKKQPS